jgi:hypothetical protein
MGLIETPPSEPFASTASAWASALPEMPGPSDRPERCPNSFRVRVPDTQVHELRASVRRAGAHGPFEVRCSGLDRQRASAAEVNAGTPLPRDLALGAYRSCWTIYISCAMRTCSHLPFSIRAMHQGDARADTAKI